MINASFYHSPIGDMLIVVENNALIGLYFKDQKYYLNNIKEELIEDDNNPLIIKIKTWLDDYFKGLKPSTSDLVLNPRGTSFQREVWEILKTIPYAETATYSDISDIIAEKHGINKMSNRAVGTAIGHNPISIIIPCHRVISKSGSLTGYAGGIERKKYLLKLEGSIK